MTDHEKLVKICYSILDAIKEQDEVGPAQFGEAGEVYEDQLPAPYEECKKRLDLELAEIKKKEEAWMFLRFYHAVKRKKIEPIEKNEHNLFTWYVLGVCPDVNFKKGPAYTEAELPDIDVDYHPVVREYLKDDFSFRQYGSQHVCNIGSYQTYGVRSSLIDMARVLGYERDEINFITKKMGLKDDEGDNVTFEGLEETFKKIEQKEKEKKPLTKYEQVAKELAVYKREHEDVWEAAKHLVVSQIEWKKFDYKKPPHRKKSMGQHASGLIIAGVNLPQFVPLIVPPGSRDKGLQASAWVEGLADTDCSSVGLIKFDYLSLEANAKVAECNRLIMDRHGLDSICAIPGLSNWSDTSYLNDPKAIEMANAGDLKGVFQFDSNGIRKLAKKGGVTSFDDLVAYSALYRPGPMDEGMHDEYCDRKNGKKDYEIHPLLLPFLGRTYGVLVYQEQVMRALNVVGDIPLKDCEAARKAISKKKKDKIEKLKEQFIDVGKVKLGVSTEWLEEFFAQIEAFAGYGFNMSLDKDTIIITKNGVKRIEDFSAGDVVFGVNENGETVEVEVVALHDHGVLDGYEVTLDDGYKVICSLDHKFLTPSGQISLREICRTHSSILCDQNMRRHYGGESERGRMADEVWFNCAHSEGNVFASEELCWVYESGLENLIKSCSSVSVRHEFSHLEGEGKTSKDLRRMSNYQGREYQITDDEIECGKLVSKKKTYNLANCQENIFKTRDNSSKIRKIENLARSESREVNQMHRGGLAKPEETVQNGGLVAGKVGMEVKKSQVRKGPKASGFSQREDVGGGRRSFPLQRTAANIKTISFFEGSAAEGRNVEQGSNEKEKCYFDQTEHGMFCIFNRGDETGMVPGTTGHAPITNAGRLVSRKIIRIMPVGKRRMYDLEVASSTHNFILPNGVVTSNSHAVAYTYISARQLWQKAHYPLEFYTAALRSLKTADDRICVYIQDARKRGIPVNRLHLNKSKFDFEIADDNEIYYGFNKIKGVGHDVATRIVELQPFSGFQDFLERFGTEAKVVQPLIGLRVFDEKDPHTLYLYYEAYKKAVKAEKDRLQRNKNSVQRYMDDLAALVGPNNTWEHGFDDNYFGKLRTMMDDPSWIKLCTLKKKYDKCVETFAEKSRNKEEIGATLSIDTWVPPSPSNKTLTLSKSAFKTYKAMKPILKDPEGVDAEVAFYGFPWKNDFEQCPNYKGYTFDDYEIDILRVHPGTSLPVEVKIMAKEHVASRSGKMWYWKLRVADALEPDVLRSVTVWEHDYDRFESLLQPGNIVKMRLYPPEHPYPNYSLEGVKPWEMRGKNPYGEDPQWDLRVVLLSKGTKKKKFFDDEDDSYLLSPGRKKKVEESTEDGDDDE